jgi:small conductance mechanosensitive channel
MEILQKFLYGIQSLLPAGTILVGAILLILVLRVFLNRYSAAHPGQKFHQQTAILVISFVALIMIIIVFPINDTLRGQLIGLIGILLTAAIALSSTTFMGNIMAGLMLRAVGNFRPGDFIRVGDHFGRVSERGLFHVEIQTEDRDLTTLPNLYLVANPVKVIRSSGTFISAEVSLGYDVTYSRVKEVLMRAAEAAELKDPFVLILELGDFSINYRVSGLLEEVKHTLSTRSLLWEKMLDKLHEAGIEIVSPTFMNTRTLSEEKVFIPEPTKLKVEVEESQRESKPEKLVFDKAEEAESIEKLREKHQIAGQEIKARKEELKQSGGGDAGGNIKMEIERLEKRREILADVIKRKEESKEN